ncbi:hypothetical protein WHR41_06893 [Cladosporium halotolerans]|uniref:Uncharacterized protein n=1 Tax=Cladosporium halotolerans TaxID=1052096 RepID=A0AB34KN78_9PEZI
MDLRFDRSSESSFLPEAMDDVRRAPTNHHRPASNTRAVMSSGLRHERITMDLARGCLEQTITYASELLSGDYDQAAISTTVFLMSVLVTIDDAAADGGSEVSDTFLLTGLPDRPDEDGCCGIGRRGSRGMEVVQCCLLAAKL